MPRQARLEAPGTLHHVIVRGIERKNIVADDNDRQDFVSRMDGLSSETDTAIYAWSSISTHAHVLLRSGAVGLPKFMRRLPTGNAVYYNHRHLRHGHLFQNRYRARPRLCIEMVRKRGRTGKKGLWQICDGRD